MNSESIGTSPSNFFFDNSWIWKWVFTYLFNFTTVHRALFHIKWLYYQSTYFHRSSKIPSHFTCRDGGREGGPSGGWLACLDMLRTFFLYKMRILSHFRISETRIQEFWHGWKCCALFLIKNARFSYTRTQNS